MYQNNEKISTTLLKIATEFNLTLYDIGLILCRKSSHPNEPSQLEKFCSLAKARVKYEKRIAMSNDAGSSRCVSISIMGFLDALSQIITEEIRNPNTITNTSTKSGMSNLPAVAVRRI